MKLAWRKKLAVMLAAPALATGAAVVAAAPAQAAPFGHVWINIGNWNCPAGGNVVAVHGAVDGVWSGGDWGDRVIYPRVDFGRSNTFNGRIYCDRPWYQPDYWSNVVWKQFRPTYWNQSFWF